MSSDHIKDNFTYNSVNLYKDNVPLDLDIDLICEELYAVGDNKSKFKEIMTKLENDVLSSDLDPPNEPQYLKPQTTKKNNNYNGYNDQRNQNKLPFKNTVPEGELLPSPSYQQKILHKKYTDVNASSKYYYPHSNFNALEANKSTWSNRANQILLNSQNNNGMGGLSNTYTSGFYNNNNNKFSPIQGGLGQNSPKNYGFN